MSGGDLMVARRRAEVDMYFAADKEIPTFYRHNCHTEACLLNLVETYNGSSNQIKGIELFGEKNLKNLILRERFYVGFFVIGTRSQVV